MRSGDLDFKRSLFKATTRRCGCRADNSRRAAQRGLGGWPTGSLGHERNMCVELTRPWAGTRRRGFFFRPHTVLDSVDRYRLRWFMDKQALAAPRLDWHVGYAAQRLHGPFFVTRMWGPLLSMLKLVRVGGRSPIWRPSKRRWAAGQLSERPGPTRAFRGPYSGASPRDLYRKRLVSNATVRTFRRHHRAGWALFPEIQTQPINSPEMLLGALPRN